jgi:hypothetical protein
VVITGKQWIVRVKNVVDEEEFDQFDEIPPFLTLMIKWRILSTNKALYLWNDHHEKVKNLTVMENMTIYAKIILSLDICVKYAQCVKIWPFFWNLDFHLIFVWNMLNVWKYVHLCENLTFIRYLCEICSMCENMIIWYLGSASEVCAVSEVLCSVSDGHYTKSDNCSVSDDEKGRRVLWGCVSYLRERKTCPCNVCLPFS